MTTKPGRVQSRGSRLTDHSQSSLKVVALCDFEVQIGRGGRNKICPDSSPRFVMLGLEFYLNSESLAENIENVAFQPGHSYALTTFRKEEDANIANERRLSEGSLKG